MASKVEICNLSISHTGSGKEIQTFDTDKSAEAQACRRFYDVARRATLRDFEWPFATKFITLGLVTTSPTSEWSYSYQYPSDCLHFRRILSGTRNDTRQSRVPYRIVHGTASKEIYCDRISAQAEYTVDIEDTERFSDDFNMAFSYRLAAYITPRITAGDPEKIGQACLQKYGLEIGMAKDTAVNEEQQEEDPDSEFIRGRN